MNIDNGRYNADISTILTYAIGRSHSLKAGVNYNRISELNSYKTLVETLLSLWTTLTTGSPWRRHTDGGV